MTTEKGTGRIFWMVRLLVGAGFVTILILIGLVGHQMRTIRAERERLQKEQEKLYQRSEEILRLSIAARGEIVSILNNNIAGSQTGAAEQLSKMIGRLDEGSQEVFAPEALKDLGVMGKGLLKIKHRSLT
ncbi:MAG: hypothetical protein ACR2G0_03700, partial [Chthoniobacterales bacterium]